MLLNLFLFGLAGLFMWIASNLITQGTESFSKTIKVSSFLVSFLILGILTSTTEISVGINSILDKRPEIFVGNLIGGSFVILLFIIPLLAIFNNGIAFTRHFDLKKLLFFLILLIAPSFLILDKEVSRYDGLLIVFLYGLFFYVFQKREKISTENLKLEKITRKESIRNLTKIIVGIVMIYFSSFILVDKTIYFAQAIEVPAFLISLMILSIGTNLPELAIAINSAFKRHSEIAFGDYIGSAAVNSLLFGIFTLIYGPFTLATNHFDFTIFILLLGYVLFFFFFRSKNSLSLYEGIILIVVYTIFILFQASDIFIVSPVI